MSAVDSLMEAMEAQSELIDIQKERIAELKYELAGLKGYRNAKKKRLKPKERRKARHLKLIAVNGVPVPAKGGVQ